MAARQPTKGRVTPPDRGGVPVEADDVLEPPRRLFAPLPDVASDEPEVERLRAQVEELGIVAERLRARALASQREAVLLSEHLTTRGALLGTLRVDTETLRLELDRSRDERDVIALQRDALSRDLDRTRATVEERDADLGALRADAAERVRATASLAAEVSELRTQLDAAQRSGAELTSSVAELTSNVAALTSNVAALTGDLEAERERSASLRAELAAALDDVAWQLGETRLAQEAARGAVVRAEAAETALAQAATQPPPALAGAADAATADALERARAEAREANDRLVATDAARDLYRHYLSSVSTTGPGRVARSWARFCREHPVTARLIRAPFAGTWRLLTLRWPWWLRQHPLFDRDWYFDVNRDVQEARLTPWWHYVRHGVREGRAPSRYFDREWYLRTYPDVKLSGMDPLDHYYRFGGWEGRDPSPRFSTDWYLGEHPDVVAAGMNALFHFMHWGSAHGYLPRPPGVVAGRRSSLAGAAGGTVRAASATPPPGTTPWAPSPSTMAPAPTPTAPATSVNVGKVRKAVRDALPEGARVGVVSDGHRDLLSMPGVEVVPVPRAANGGPASDVPRNELSAIAHVESLRVDHVDYLAVPEPSLWMTIVPGLQRHLLTRYASVGRRGDGAAILDVRSPLRHDAADGEDVRSLLRAARERLGRETSVLDWGSGTVHDADVPGVSMFSPSSDAARRSLPYADASIDVVVLPDGDAERLAEARRVAGTLVIGAGGGSTGVAAGVAARVEWVDGEQRPTTTSVSIVIPTFDDVTMLATCLRTIDETVDGREVEVIVSDDGSDAAYVEPLEALAARHPRVRLVRSATNGGYIAAVNAGAATATNDVLVLLNNDTILLPGWLEPLLDTLRDRPRTGVVGGMLLYPDGRLQEAGCAIFRDGSATKVGYGDSDPTLPYYAHPRAVDYVSGALLATPRELFERLGGLDPAFGFGYYEDGDYCFRARREGLDVVYQPRSVVVHVEGGTAGTDVSKGAKRYQATNQALFVERWRAELQHQPVRPELLDIHASRDLVIRGRGPTASP